MTARRANQNPNGEAKPSPGKSGWLAAWTRNPGATAGSKSGSFARRGPAPFVRSNRGRRVSAWADDPQGTIGTDVPLWLELARARAGFERREPLRRVETSATGAGRIGRRTESSARPALRAQRAPTASR